MTSAEHDTIAIASRDGYQKTVADLTTLAGKVTAAQGEGQKLIEKLTTAAAVSSAPAGSPASGGQTAPCLAETLEATKKAVSAAEAELTAAGQSLTNALSDLRRLYQGVTGADDRGEQGVKGS